MSESCHRGHKCMCFQCRENDCEKYQSEPPEWFENEPPEWFEKVYKMLKEKGVEKSIQKMKEAE